MEFENTFGHTFLTFVLMCVARVSSSDFTQLYFKSLRSLNGYITTGLATPETFTSLSRCANECIRRESCLSFHYRSSTHQCYILGHYVTVVDSWQPETGVKTYWKPTDTCPSTSGYVLLPEAGICVKVVHQQTKTWAEAQTACANDGGHLMIMDTEDKLLAVKNHFLANGFGLEVDYSIGAMNQTFLSRTEFHWLNGDPMTFQSWFPGMPQDTADGQEKCVEFVPEWYWWDMAGDMWHWNDMTCDWSINYICEIPVA